MACAAALRHLVLIDAGLSPKAVQTFAGHSSLQVTMDRYGHLFKSDAHNEAMNAIAREMLAPSGLPTPAGQALRGIQPLAQARQRH
jgi:hypothetical protein